MKLGLDINKSIIAGFLSATLGSGGATILGKTLFTQIIKLIPGAGSLVGGTISAATAGGITAALGEVYILIMEKVFIGEMSLADLITKAGRDQVKEMFKTELSRNR